MLGWVEPVDIGVGDKEPVDVPDLIQRPAHQHPLLAQSHRESRLDRFFHILFRGDTWEVQVLLGDVVGVEPAHRIGADSFCSVIEDDEISLGFVHGRTVFTHEQGIAKERFEWASIL